ncbi:MAG TPA: FecR family protein [Spirochaetota bacterium]|nr:FecR family protein [Spirochaetota bacterium]HNT11380.1 FecR family protein [Spirochaetota bacterium]
MQKRALIIIAIVVSLVAGCSKTAGIDATIIALGGEVTLNGAKPSLGSKIAFGDAIETGEKSFCEIVVKDKNVFRMGASTRLVFRVSADSNILQLDRGWFAGVTRKIFTKQLEYLIKTPTVTAGVRGTSYCIKVEKPESTYFCVCNGSIDLRDEPGKPGERVTTAHHKGRRYTRDTDGRIAIDKKPGMLYHDDAGLEALAKKIGETIDWTKPDEK